MKIIIFMLFIASCAQTPVKKESAVEEDLVSVGAALNHAQASYLKGCVDAYKNLHIPASFIGCRDKAYLHRQELDSLMGIETKE